MSLPGAFVGSLWIIEPEAGDPFRKLLDLPAGDLVRGVAWAADGGAVILGRIRSSGDIILAERTMTR